MGIRTRKRDTAIRSVERRPSDRFRQFDRRLHDRRHQLCGSHARFLTLPEGRCGLGRGRGAGCGGRRAGRPLGGGSLGGGLPGGGPRGGPLCGPRGCPLGGGRGFRLARSRAAVLRSAWRRSRAAVRFGRLAAVRRGGERSRRAVGGGPRGGGCRGNVLVRTEPRRLSLRRCGREWGSAPRTEGSSSSFIAE